MLGQLLETFNEGLTARRKQEWDADQAEAAREFDILRLMAEKGSPEIQAVAGAALLEMASGSSGRRVRKGGLRGFLGETEKSPYLDQVKQAISQTQMTAPAAPKASLPAGSPVEPGGPRITAPAPPPLSPDPYVTAEPLISQQVDGMRTLTPPGDNLALPSQQLGAGAPMAMAGMAAPPPPPPKPAYTRLFPTAREIAAEQTGGALQGRVDVMQGALQQAGASPQQMQEALMGMAGAPQRRPLATQAMIFTLRDGTEIIGVFDPNDQSYEIDGQKIDPTMVMNARKPSSTAPRPPTVRTSTDAQGNVTAFVPPELKPGQSQVLSGVRGKPQAPPPSYAGQPQPAVDAQGNRVFIRSPRDNAAPEVVPGFTPLPTGSAAKSSEQVAAVAALKEVDAAIKAATTKNYVGNVEVLTEQKRQKIVDEIGVKYRIPKGTTYADLAMAAGGGTLTQRGARSGKSPEDIQKLMDVIRGKHGSNTQAPPAPPPARR